jgi:hypothetical protein
MQYEAEIALIELIATDTEEWSRRLSQRGYADAGTERSHKPGSVEDVYAIIKRNNGSESWSNDVRVPCHVVLDSCSTDSKEESIVDDMVKKIIQELQKAGLIES